MTDERNLNLNWRLCCVKEPPLDQRGEVYFLGKLPYACPNRFSGRSKS